MNEATQAVPPPEFSGCREAEIWARVLSVRSVPPAKAELLTIYCKAAVDEEQARAEMNSAMRGGDANGARMYAAIAKEMRSTMTRTLDLIK